MPQNATRAKPSKSKKLSLQRVLRSKDKTDKQLNMGTDTGYNEDHAASDNDPEFSQHSINKNLTEETRAKSNISPNNFDSNKVISKGENLILRLHDHCTTKK